MKHAALVLLTLLALVCWCGVLNSTGIAAAPMRVNAGGNGAVGIASIIFYPDGDGYVSEVVIVYEDGHYTDFLPRDLLATQTPDATYPGTPTATPMMITPTPEGITADCYGIVTAETGLNIRGGPSVTAAIVGRLAYNSRVQITGAFAGGAWYVVPERYTEGAGVGYIAATYVRLGETCEGVK